MPRKILILAANPKKTDRLRLDQEVREIQEGLERSRRRDEFQVIDRWAVRPDDLRRALLDFEPEIVHFSGHGQGGDGLCLENDAGEVKLVSSQALARLFKLFDGRTKCILLNACYSVEQAEQLRAHADYVIGMKAAVGDAAALRFAVGFYDALGAGRGYADAFEFGCAAIELEGIPEADVPVLLTRGQGNSAVQIIDPAATNRKVEEECQLREEQERRARLDREQILTPQNIHGWSAAQVQTLQREVAQSLGLPLAFRDRLQDEDGGQGPEMLIIPPGRFLMGSPKDEKGRAAAEIQHSVAISRPFAIGRFPVTFDEYDAFCLSTKRDRPNDRGWGRGDRPVINISWGDAAAYCDWLSRYSGQIYRLPTEAEWEYVCRAATVTPFWWGNTITPAQANYKGYDSDNGGTKGEYRKKTLPVNSFDSNPWGLYQIHGNVREWCHDWSGDYSVEPVKDPAGPQNGDYRVIRGGGWDDYVRHCRAAFRASHEPGKCRTDLGFRLARVQVR